MRSLLLLLASSSLLFTLACDGGGSGGAGGGGSGGAAGGAGGSGGAAGGSGGAAGGAGGTGGAAGGSGGVGGAPACDALPAGPIAFSTFATGFAGSEDLAFDGKGNLALRDGNKVVLVDAGGAATDLATGVASSYGMRFLADGRLAVALPNAGKLVQISPAGAVSDLFTGVGGPNGVYADVDGAVLVTEFGADKVTRFDAQGVETTLVTQAFASAPNGVVRDAATNDLFYTNYQAGEVMVYDLDANGTPELFEQIPGAFLDGMALDACGNVYVVDQGSSKLYRIKRDASGAKVGSAELLATFPQNVANPQFGRGVGFEAESLYLAGVPGVVYVVPVGVPGAPIPLAP